ncbi:class II aldolase/adducin family protein [Paenibacillus sp. 1011MAR3C5]|uniref:class II aldolase/adducin family protein n=1 Tax=Paenibacillus sp. 1011MAR3C5 TaxID=1675787 RepID=UPI000E6BDE4E|nr:class II aldolase/adducin family protein [Paenibacillus sp. 1011MAR3C5]RJE83963.1 class II aldolase/adducin family protein [Paenibacillus sp. 1011MAR3C5]
MPNASDIRKELQHTGKYMMQYGLAWGNAGNISARSEGDRYVITASGTFLGELDETDLIECDMSGAVYGTERKVPSKETPMHRAVYENRPEIGAVLHASPFYSTLVACSDIEIPSNWFVETMYYLEKVERVPYYHPGSEALGEGVREKAKHANILLLENHGVLVYDTSIREARMALQTLEMACRMLVESQSAGIPMKGLSRDTEMDFLEKSDYKPRRNWNLS